MRAGKLREIITIQQRIDGGVTELNEPIETWGTFAAGVFCDVEARRGKEQFNPETGQRFSETVYHFTVRYSEIEGMSADMRIIYEGQIYDVRDIRPDRARKVDAVIEATLQNGVV